MSNDSLSIIQSAAGLVANVRGMIVETRTGLARAASTVMTLLCWRIGKRTQAGVLKHDRAEPGQEILATLSQELTSREAIYAHHR